MTLQPRNRESRGHSESRARQTARRWLLAWMLPWLCLNFFGEALHHHPLLSPGGVPISIGAAETDAHAEPLANHQSKIVEEGECLICAWAAQSVGVSVPFVPPLPAVASTCHTSRFLLAAVDEIAVAHSSRGPPLS